jgi:hypothetical protein
LAEFKEIILNKIHKAQFDLDWLRVLTWMIWIMELMTSPTFKAFEEGSESMSKKQTHS